MTEKHPDRSAENQAKPALSMIHPRIGRLASGRIAGEIYVEVDDTGPAPARLLSGLNRHELLKTENLGREVLVVFADGDPGKPVIVGMMENILEDLISLDPPPMEIPSDGERVVIRADREILLTCGDGSLSMKKDGRIVIRGTDIVSRASNSNKIKGSHVDIN
jgi:hypothetical protein